MHWPSSAQVASATSKQQQQHKPAKDPSPPSGAALGLLKSRPGGCARAVHETIRVKSAAWDDAGVLVYTTLNHIKYCLPNGDSGIIRTLDTPVYITLVAGGTIHALDRDGKVRQIEVRAAALGFLASLY